MIATDQCPDPDMLLAHVRLLRLTDRLLDAADDLRNARDSLQALLDRPMPDGRQPVRRQEAAQ
jgi:hypothetical protein